MICFIIKPIKFLCKNIRKIIIKIHKNIKLTVYNTCNKICNKIKNFIYKTYVIYKYFRYFISLHNFIKNNNSHKNHKYFKKLESSIYNCGPFGIKFIQFLIMYDKLIPYTQSKQLYYTLENCKIHSWKDTEELYYKNFNRNIYDDFELADDPLYDHNDKVIGSGSIGQVYKLYSKSLNKYVAIKVRHPHIDKDIDEFVSTISIIINFTSLFIKIPLKKIIGIYKDNIVIQSDFINEAKNTLQIRTNFKKDNYNIIVPEVYDYKTDFIIMSYHEGKTIDTIDNKTKLMISNDINFIILSSIMVHDFIHSDLHNGNWKIELLENNKYNIIIYDCGLVIQTGNIKFNQDIIHALMVSNYNQYYKMIKNVYQPYKNEKPYVKINKFNELLKYIKTVKSDSLTPPEKLNKILKYTIENDIVRNNNIINLILTINMTNVIHSIGVDKNKKIFGNIVESNSFIIFCTYVGILERIKKYEKLKNYFIEYIHTNNNYKANFNNWLLTTFGHDDADIYYDIITKYIFPSAFA